jgi:hypothetical protein
MKSPYHGQSTFASFDQIFHNHNQLVEIVDTQPIALQIYQHSSGAKNLFSIDLGPRNPKNLLGNKKNIQKLYFM